jgi:hypothetical protein
MILLGSLLACHDVEPSLRPPGSPSAETAPDPKVGGDDAPISVLPLRPAGSLRTRIDVVDARCDGSSTRIRVDTLGPATAVTVVSEEAEVGLVASADIDPASIWHRFDGTLPGCAPIEVVASLGDSEVDRAQIDRIR